MRPDRLYASQQRFGLYRWHIMDPALLEHNLGDRGPVGDLHLRRGSAS